MLLLKAGCQDFLFLVELSGQLLLRGVQGGQEVISTALRLSSLLFGSLLRFLEGIGFLFNGSSRGSYAAQLISGINKQPEKDDCRSTREDAKRINKVRFKIRNIIVGCGSVRQGDE